MNTIERPDRLSIISNLQPKTKTDTDERVERDPEKVGLREEWERKERTEHAIEERERDEREVTESLDLKIGEEKMHWDAEEIEKKKND